MEKQQSAETLQKRKFLMILPLLILPFITMAFWALGGGQASATTAVAEPQKGFNTELPQAQFDTNEKQDKFSIYEASAKKSDQISDDACSSLAFSESFGNDIDPNEEKINEKLSQINAELNKQTNSPTEYSPSRTVKPNNSGNMTADVRRLENLMENIQTGDGEDEEMASLNAVLEKILDIQHPVRTREKINKKTTASHNGAFAVHVANRNESQESFFSLSSQFNNSYAHNPGNAIQATIHQDQDIVSGSVVKLRLLDSIVVNGNMIPKNEFVYGIASVDDERLKISLATLRYRNSILPVSLSAYDLDGLEGLYIPGAITRDASKKGVDDAIQSLQIMSMDPSVSAQVAGAGIQAAKGLFGRKVKQVRVKVKAGYQLLLRDTNSRTQ